MPKETTRHVHSFEFEQQQSSPSPVVSSSWRWRRQQLQFKSLWLDEATQQCKTAFPTLMGMLLSRIPWLISLRFVGDIGAQELAAAALASTLCNVTGLSLSVGLSSALTTLTAQARGDLIKSRSSSQLEVIKTPTTSVLSSEENDDVEENAVEREGLLLSEEKRTSQASTVERDPSTVDSSSTTSTSTSSSSPLLLPLVYLYQGMFIQLLFVLPIGLWWLGCFNDGIKPTLMALGQGERLSTMTQDYLRILTVGLWSYSINWTLTAWLQAIEMAHVPAIAAAVGLVTHVPFNMFFIYTLDLGYLGCAVATVTFQLIQPILILIYVFVTRAGRKRVLGSMAASAVGRTTLSFWCEAKRALDFRGIRTYLSLALPGIVVISEWWASEVTIFLSGRLKPFPELALGAMTLYQSINTFCFMFPVACSVAGSTRVGNLLGSGDVEGANLASKVSILGAGLVSGCLGCILYFVAPHTYFPSLFAPDEHDLIVETSRTIPLLSLYVFADGVQSAFNGIIKGCGRQAVTMPIVVFAYWIVGVPLAYVLAFVRHDGNMLCEDDSDNNNSIFCGVVGLVTGMTTGTWVHMLLLGIVVLGTTNWQTEARKAKERLHDHSYHHHQRKDEAQQTR